MIKISPSVLACDFSRLGEEVYSMQQAGAEMIHLDVMDGNFVPNISFGAPVITSIRPHFTLQFDTHLMVQNPLDFIPAFAKAGSDYITFHVESQSDTLQTIDSIHSHGLKAGLSLKPNTPVSVIEPFLPSLDLVLVMTVEPGFGGQKFMRDMLDKITVLNQLKQKHAYSYEIEVDGGIDLKTAPQVVACGATVLVAGSSLFGSSNYSEAVRQLREAGQSALQPSTN